MNGQLAFSGRARSMPAADTPEISDVLSRVRSWTPGMRIVLARKVLETLDSPAIAEPPRAMALDEVLGVLRTDAPPPNDRQCDEIVREERAGKYG